MLIIDNSEYMRNSDYPPTRLQAQSDAVNIVFQTKVDANPENTVGIMTMAGNGPEVLVTHTKDLGQILQALHKASLKIDGNIDMMKSISIAQLALKHRQNKNLRQRIVVFVGSPLHGAGTDEKSMVKLAKKLKKNNVAIDVVCYGDGIENPLEEDRSVLGTFVEHASNGENSHLVCVPPQSSSLSDALLTSPVLSEDRNSSIPSELSGTGNVAASGAPNDFEFGVDPNLDPELAMALRLSMQDQARETIEGSAMPNASIASTSAPSATPPVRDLDEEERLLQQALAVSEGRDVDMEGGKEVENENEDADIARAIEMSMQEGAEEKEEKQ